MKTSYWAGASLVCSMLWLFGTGSILGLVFASVANREIEESEDTLRGNYMVAWAQVLAVIGLIATAAVIGATVESMNAASAALETR